MGTGIWILGITEHACAADEETQGNVIMYHTMFDFDAAKLSAVWFGDACVISESTGVDDTDYMQTRRLNSDAPSRLECYTHAKYKPLIHCVFRPTPVACTCLCSLSGCALHCKGVGRSLPCHERLSTSTSRPRRPLTSEVSAYHRQEQKPSLRPVSEYVCATRQMGPGQQSSSAVC